MLFVQNVCFHIFKKRKFFQDLHLSAFNINNLKKRIPCPMDVYIFERIPKLYMKNYVKFSTWKYYV